MKKMGDGSSDEQIDLLEAPREGIYNWAKDSEFKEHMTVLEKMMEEMAGKDTTEYGKRTTGERCMYEIQRAESRKERSNTEVHGLDNGDTGV